MKSKFTYNHFLKVIEERIDEKYNIPLGAYYGNYKEYPMSEIAQTFGVKQNTFSQYLQRKNVLMRKPKKYEEVRYCKWCGKEIPIKLNAANRKIKSNDFCKIRCRQKFLKKINTKYDYSKEAIEKIRKRYFKGEFLSVICEDLGINDKAIFAYFKRHNIELIKPFNLCIYCNKKIKKYETFCNDDCYRAHQKEIIISRIENYMKNPGFCKYCGGPIYPKKIKVETPYGITTTTYMNKVFCDEDCLFTAWAECQKSKRGMDYFDIYMKTKPKFSKIFHPKPKTKEEVINMYKYFSSKVRAKEVLEIHFKEKIPIKQIVSNLGLKYSQVLYNIKRNFGGKL